jgi:hypothetical protein
MTAPVEVFDRRADDLAWERLWAASEVLREIRSTSPAWQLPRERPSLTLIQGGRDAS